MFYLRDGFWGNALALKHVDEVAVRGEFVDEGRGQVLVLQESLPLRKA